MGNAEYPTPEIILRPSQPQMLKEGEKHLLHHFLGVVIEDAHRIQIAQQGAPGLLKKAKNFLLYRALFLLSICFRMGRQYDRPIW